MKICRLSILLLSVAILCACGNHSNQDIETMSEYCTNDSFLCCKIPSFLHLTKNDGQSMQFEGNKKFAKVMIVSSYDRAVKDDFVQQLVGDNRSKLTVIEENDTITAFEIQRGMTTIPAQVVSIYQRNGYAVLLAMETILILIIPQIGQLTNTLSRKLPLCLLVIVIIRLEYGYFVSRKMIISVLMKP